MKRKKKHTYEDKKKESLRTAVLNIRDNFLTMSKIWTISRVWDYATWESSQRKSLAWYVRNSNFQSISLSYTHQTISLSLDPLCLHFHFIIMMVIMYSWGAHQPTFLLYCFCEIIQLIRNDPEWRGHITELIASH